MKIPNYQGEIFYGHCAYYEYVLENLQSHVAELLYDQFRHKEEKIQPKDLLKIFPLLDSTIRINERGTYQIEPNKLPFISLVAYTFKTFSELANVKDPLADQRWKDFCQAIKIRNRITHPKQSEEINISDLELQQIFRSREWWLENVNTIYSFKDSSPEKSNNDVLEEKPL